ncbi:MAG: hypothetical protein QF879_13570 [Candidatus Latescibacteria bacterium]|nr:hypothetical protein [Candidatus Latescibacterota bacterium]
MNAKDNNGQLDLVDIVSDSGPEDPAEFDGMDRAAFFKMLERVKGLGKRTGKDHDGNDKRNSH